jgi:tRNA(fMet)-specific endonuclease VapC
MLKYLLDTDTIIYTIKNRPDHMRSFFKRHEEQISISTVTLGELVFGAEHSTQVERNLADIEAMSARLEVLPYDIDAAYHFGRIRSELYRLGQPIGPYDMMIAGHARARGLILVSNNTREFSRVPGLMIENWVDKKV